MQSHKDVQDAELPRHDHNLTTFPVPPSRLRGTQSNYCDRQPRYLAHTLNQGLVCGIIGVSVYLEAKVNTKTVKGRRAIVNTILFEVAIFTCRRSAYPGIRILENDPHSEITGASWGLLFNLTARHTSARRGAVRIMQILLFPTTVRINANFNIVSRRQLHMMERRFR